MFSSNCIQFHGQSNCDQTFKYSNTTKLIFLFYFCKFQVHGYVLEQQYLDIWEREILRLKYEPDPRLMAICGGGAIATS